MSELVNACSFVPCSCVMLSFVTFSSSAVSLSFTLETRSTRSPSVLDESSILNVLLSHFVNVQLFARTRVTINKNTCDVIIFVNDAKAKARTYVCLCMTS